GNSVGDKSCAIRISAERAVDRQRDHQADEQPIALFAPGEQRLVVIAKVGCSHFPREQTNVTRVLSNRWIVRSARDDRMPAKPRLKTPRGGAHDPPHAASDFVRPMKT